MTKLTKLDPKKVAAATKKFVRTMTDPEGQKAVEQIAEKEILRDRFAMAVMTGLLAAEDNTGDLGELDPGEFYADRAYRYADVMMERRKR